jgi:hypothetical protein
MKNKIFTTIAFILLLYNNSNGQTLITNNKELNMKPQTENAELLKKRLEESLASDLKEVNEMQERMRKIIASDLKEEYRHRDSISKGLNPKDSIYYQSKNFFLQKEGKNIKLNHSLNKYEETDMSQDSSENFVYDDSKDFARIVIIQGKLSGYRKHEHNKTTYISFSPNSNANFTKRETAEDSLVERYSEFYPNGKLKLTMEDKYKNGRIANTDEFVSTEFIQRNELPPTMLLPPEKVISTGYLYDKDGTLIEIYEYDYDDSLFEFTKEDVMACIREEYKDKDSHVINIEKWAQYTVNGEIKQKTRWAIKITERNGLRIRFILLDAKTGEKLSEDTWRISK